MKKRNWSLFICIALLLTSLHTPIMAGATDSTQDVDGLFAKEVVDDYREEGTYPEKEGYVFAGWYKDSSRETPVIGATPAEGAYAKFVGEDVTKVLFQLPSGTTVQSETTDLRVITSVDSLLYKEVGFKLQVDGNPFEITSNTVYSTIASYVDETEQKYQPSDVFDEDESEYFVTKIITGIRKASFTKEISFTSFWVTMDGTKVSETERTIEIFDEVKLVADPLGFIAGSNDSTHSKVEKVTFGGEEVIKADFRKVLFKGIQTVETQNSALVSDFIPSGYTHVQFDMYIETPGSAGMNFNTSQQSVWTNGNGFDWTDVAVGDTAKQGDFVRTYNMDGKKAPITAGAWYTVSMRVDDNSTDVSIVSLSQIHTIAYLKNLQFTNDFPVENILVANPLGFIAGSNDSTHSKVEKVTFGGEEVIRADFRKVLFEGIQTVETQNSPLVSDFHPSGYTHVQFDMYIETPGSAGMNFNTSQQSVWTNGNGFDWTDVAVGDTAKQGDYVRTYKDGVRMPITAGAWYTVSMRVDANSTDVSVVSLSQIHTIAYFKNLTFTNAFPVENRLVANPLGFVSGGASHTTVEQATFGGENVIKVDGRKVCFQDVIDANGVKGAFFGSGYKYVQFDVYYDAWTSDYNAIYVNTSTATVAANVEANGDASAWNDSSLVSSYKDGAQANLKAGAWYTVCVKVESWSSDVSFCSPHTASVFYMKNLTFTDSLPQ